MGIFPRRKAGALVPITNTIKTSLSAGLDTMERVMGIEPTSQTWKVWALPLSYTRGSKLPYCWNSIIFFRGARIIRQRRMRLWRESDSVFGVLGFEPRSNPPKGLVLPLHYTPIKT